MKRNIKNQFSKKSEFRFHDTIIKSKKKFIRLKNHPVYVFLQYGDYYFYVQLTHSSRIKGKEVIKLRRNPNPSDKTNAYYIKEIKYDLVKNFERKREEWSMDKNDDSDIRKLFKQKSPTLGIL